MHALAGLSFLWEKALRFWLVNEMKLLNALSTCMLQQDCHSFEGRLLDFGLLTEWCLLNALFTWLLWQGCQFCENVWYSWIWPLQNAWFINVWVKLRMEFWYMLWSYENRLSDFCLLVSRKNCAIITLSFRFILKFVSSDCIYT